MKTISFDINNYVRVRITPHGKECLRKNYDELAEQYAGGKLGFEFMLPKEDSDGWSEWQAWCLMKELGPHISMSGPVPFETEIQIKIQ